MSASPAATPVTTPALVTLAIDVFDEDHAAWAVAVWVAPFESKAVAENCTLVPTPGAVPLTLTDNTVGLGVVVVDPPQPATTPSTATTRAVRRGFTT